MSSGVHGSRLLVFVWLAFTAAAHPRAQQIGRTPVDLQVSQPPTVVMALGRGHLVYELHVTNFGAATVTLEGLEVLREGGPALVNWTAPQLAQRVTILGEPAAGPTSAKTLLPGARAIVYLWISLAVGQAAPESLTHRLTMSPGAAGLETVTMAPVRVQPPAGSIGAPVRGGPWLAVRGPSNTSPHRLAVVALTGHARVPQRFAVDWALLGDDGLLFSGDGTALTSWYGYRAPVYAAAAGTVVMTRDGAPDRAPFGAPPPPVMAAADATGNLIVLDVGGGRFVTYAHLQAGSLTVAQGDRVREGQPLARIGNSGNTLGPHLHFQVADSREPLSGEGLPFALRRFELTGRVSSVLALLGRTPWKPTADQPARIVTDETPLENMVVRFDGPPQAALPPR